MSQTLTINRLVEPRPADIPGDWDIFNAPRPLYGTKTWQGEFRHGIFFAAIDPANPYANQMHKDNLSNDGWLCEYITEAQVMAWATAYMAENGYDITDCEWRDILGSYYQNVGRETRAAHPVQSSTE